MLEWQKCKKSLGRKKNEKEEFVSRKTEAFFLISFLLFSIYVG